jgi:hypothetical protein
MATYVITLHTREGDGVRTLRAALKVLLRRFGLRAIKVEQATDHRSCRARRVQCRYAIFCNSA